MKEHVVHASLWRPILFAGAEPGFVIVEVATVLALLFIVGIHVQTVALAALYATAVHSTAVWVATKDPEMSRVYLRSLGVHDWYAPIPRASAPAARARPLVPRTR